MIQNTGSDIGYIDNKKNSCFWTDQQIYLML